jgi:hypothetical protein
MINVMLFVVKPRPIIHASDEALMHFETNIGVKSLEEAVAREARGGVHIKWSTRYLIAIKGRLVG